ncbi:hypothetical protein [Syntrophorhabdus aromaticivorans]|uniref:hypothetical protein n=1 Tax=Syntrophorhabdus aromaticivorans TaxID=328301 RepID=UPI00048FB7DB|nr:hypothetical protein [Syntrophorhabdus aromaticivorans]
MDMWKSQSNSGKQMTASVACAVVGLILVVGFHDFAGFDTNTAAAFALGLLLLLIGVPGFLLSCKQTVIVDPGTRRITIEDSNRFHRKKRSIPFSDIACVNIGYIGKRSNYVTWYYLMLKLRSGEDYPLFAPGRFYDGGSDRSTVEGWKQRLEGYLGR